MVTNGLRPNKEESAENVKPGYIRIAGVAILKWLVVAGRKGSLGGRAVFRSIDELDEVRRDGGRSFCAKGTPVAAID